SRSAADQTTVVSRHRFLPADTRHTAERTGGGEVSAGKHSPRCRNSRGGRGKCAGGPRQHPISRCLSAGGLQAEQAQMSIWRAARTLEQLNASREGTLLKHLDIRFSE